MPSDVVVTNFGVPKRPATVGRIKSKELKRDGLCKIRTDLLEVWINDILQRSTVDEPQRYKLKCNVKAMTGALQHGIGRPQLGSAGLSDDDVNRLYRGLYVYSVGFFDLLQSGYLDLVDLHKNQSIQLFAAKEALAEARENNTEMEKTIAWLTASHSEERTLRRKLAYRMDNMKSDLEKERLGHAFAVKQYLQEMDERSRVQHELQYAHEQFGMLQEAKSAIESDLEMKQSEHRQLVEAMNDVSARLGKVQQALHLELGSDENESPNQGNVVDKAMYVQDQMEVLYNKWQTEMQDKKNLHNQMLKKQDENHILKGEIAGINVELKSGGRRIYELTSRLAKAAETTEPLQKELKETKHRLGETKSELEQCAAKLKETEGKLFKAVEKNAILENQCSILERENAENRETIGDLTVEVDRLKDVAAASHTQHTQSCVALATVMRFVQVLQVSRRRANAHLAHEREANNKLTGCVARAENRIACLEEELDATNTKMAKREVDYFSLKKLKDEVDGKLDKSVRQEESRRYEIDALKDKLEKSKKSLNRLAVDHDAVQHQLDNLEAAHSALKDGKQRVDTSIEITERKLHLSSQQKTQVERELHVARAELKTTVDEHTRALLLVKADLSKMQTLSKTLENKLKQANAAKDKKDAEIESLQDEFERKHAKKEKWKGMWQQADQDRITMEEVLSEKDSVLRELQERLTSIEKGMKGVSRCVTPQSVTESAPEFNAKALAEALENTEAEPNEFADTENIKEMDQKIKKAENCLSRLRKEQARIGSEVSPPSKLRDMVTEVNTLHRQKSELLKKGPSRSTLQVSLMDDQSEQKYTVVSSRIVKAESKLARIQYLYLLDLLEANEKLQHEVDGLRSQIHLSGEDIKGKAEEMDSMKDEISKCSQDLRELKEEKGELESLVKQANSMVSFHQAEVSALKNERDRQKAHLSDAEIKIDQLERQVENAGKTLKAHAKELQSNFSAEKRSIVEAFSEERREWEAEMTARRHELNTLTENFDKTQKVMRDVSIAYVRTVESHGASWLHHMYNSSLAHVHKEVGLWELGNPFEATSPISKLSLSYETVLILISQLYVEKLKSDDFEDSKVVNPPGNRLSLEEVTYDFFLAKFGVRHIAEIHIAALISAVEKYKENNRRVRMFSQLLGHTDPFPPGGVDFFMAMISRIHARAGVLLTEATEGSSEVQVLTLGRIFREIFRGSVAPEVSNLSDRLFSLVGRDESNPIDLDIAIELAMEAWMVQRGRDEAQVQSMFRHTDARGNGIVTSEDMQSVLRHVDHRGASALSPSAVQLMFRQAIRRSGGGNKVKAPAFAHVAFSTGFAGLASQNRRHEDVPHFPPYDEFRLLEDSWKAFRGELQTLIEKIERHARMANLVMGINQQITSFTDILREREESDEAWVEYRKIMAFFATHRFSGNLCEQGADGQSLQTLSINIPLPNKEKKGKRPEEGASAEPSGLEADEPTPKSTARSGSLFGEESTSLAKRKMSRGAIPKRSPRIDERSHDSDEYDSDEF
ncbi:hypothetical protein BSKO_05095 [Bryopsis sp. KO-2023]|nr:hypothetical protein BSKO_05095 [Bryopsis sp. KO-2023]